MMCAILLGLMLAACSSLSQNSPTPDPASRQPAAPPANPAPDHVPAILQVVEREERKDGYLLIAKDIYFTDAAGDATTLTNKLVSYDPAGGIWLTFSDDSITASPDQQKHEGLVTSTFGCPSILDPYSFTLEDRIRDQADNFSGPVTFTVSCAATSQNNTPFLIAGGIVGLGLLLGVWLHLRAHPSERGSTTRSILMVFCSLLPVTFLLLILHEGGHALSGLGHTGATPELFVHPFSISGYSRPMFEWDDVWTHAAGAATAILGSLLISLPFWKRRSASTFALVALFPLAAINNGVYILSVDGDFRNIMHLTGLPSIVFNIIGFMIAAVGLVCLLSLLPLLGLSPRDKKALLVLPAGYFLWGLLSTVVAYLFIPGSPFVVRWHLAGEILQSANSFLWVPLLGLFIGVIYLTFYRRVYTRLPAGLQTATASLVWKDLRIPALLFAISLVLGLIVIA
jgi:hypothetical protein